MVVVATAVRWPGGAHGGPSASRVRRPAATAARRVGAEPERKAVTVRFGTLLGNESLVAICVFPMP
jgi:hypothetical protein